MDWLKRFENGFDQRWDGVVIPAGAFHFHRRLWERYGVVLGPGHYSKIMKQIQRKRAIAIEFDQDRGTTVYGIYLPGSSNRVALIVSDGRHLVSALPPKKAAFEKFFLAKALTKEGPSP